MRVKMLVSMAGPTMRKPGQVIEVDKEEGKRLIAAGFAVPAAIETATVEPPENAMKKPLKRRKKGK